LAKGELGDIGVTSMRSGESGGEEPPPGLSDEDPDPIGEGGDSGPGKLRAREGERGPPPRPWAIAL